MPAIDLHRIAQEYADLFNQIEPGAVEDVIDEACVDPHWDDRTNLLSLLANGPEDLGLVLSSGPGGVDYVVVRFVGKWIVDTDPVDWDKLEMSLFIQPRRVRSGFAEDEF